MADDGHIAEWDEVGRRFGELGRRLQEAWSEARPERTAAEHEEGGRKVGAALDELKTSIRGTVSDPEVREAADRATAGFTDALASNLRQLAEWIERKPGSGPPPGDTVVGDPGPGTTTTTDDPPGGV
jgi:hypothetical protein